MRRARTQPDLYKWWRPNMSVAMARRQVIRAGIGGCLGLKPGRPLMVDHDPIFWDHKHHVVRPQYASACAASLPGHVLCASRFFFCRSIHRGLTGCLACLIRHGCAGPRGKKHQAAEGGAGGLAGGARCRRRHRSDLSQPHGTRAEASNPAVKMEKTRRASASISRRAGASA